MVVIMTSWQEEAIPMQADDCSADAHQSINAEVGDIIY